MSEYTFYYTNLRGVGEPARQLFKLAGVPFKDVRIELEDWPAFKPQTPFLQPPMLVVDGIKISKFTTIIRFLGRQFGFAGKDPLQEAVVDSLFDMYKEYFEECRNYYGIRIGMRTGDLEAVYANEFSPAKRRFFGVVEQRLAENGSGFLVLPLVAAHRVQFNAEPTYVDVTLADHMASLLAFDAAEFDAFPLTLRMKRNVESLPPIAKWLAERPVTKF